MYEHVAVHATAQREHEAVIDLLLLVMLSDRHISGLELDSIRAIAEDSGFDSDSFSFEQYRGPASAKVRAALADGTMDELLDSIDQRITSRVLRQSVYGAAREVADADDTINSRETTLLGNIAARFD